MLNTAADAAEAARKERRSVWCVGTSGVGRDSSVMVGTPRGDAEAVGLLYRRRPTEGGSPRRTEEPPTERLPFPRRSDAGTMTPTTPRRGATRGTARA